MFASPSALIPTDGATFAVVYLTYTPWGSDDIRGVVDASNMRLAEVGMDGWPGPGSLSCDFGSEEALGVEDGRVTGLYFDTPDEAHRFAGAWERYFGEPPFGVVDEIKTYCLGGEWRPTSRAAYAGWVDDGRTLQTGAHTQRCEGDTDAHWLAPELPKPLEYGSASDEAGARP